MLIIKHPSFKNEMEEVSTLDERIEIEKKY